MFLRRSFTRAILILFVISALVLSAAYYLVLQQSMARYEAGDEIWILLTEEPNRLSEGQFDQITEKDLNGTAFLVFNEQGHMLYASDGRISAEFSYADTAFLPEYIGGEETLSVYETEGEDRQFIIARSGYDAESGREILTDYCRLDGNLNILEGDLFPGRTGLTVRELNLLDGEWSGGQTAKSVLSTDRGEITVVWTYDQEAVQPTGSLLQTGLDFLPFLIVAAAVILLWMFFLRYLIKVYNAPLNEVIDAYGRGERVKIVPEEIPVEFEPFADRFNEMADHLEEANEEKERIYREREGFMADLSHDLKTPLTVIRGYTQAFLDGKVPEEKREEYLRTIHDKAALSTDMIDRLLEYTKLEQPVYDGQMRELDLAEFSRSYLAEKHEELRLLGIDLSVDIPETVMVCRADPELILRLYDNLIGNSVKYGEGAPVFFSMSIRDGEIRIVVADDGPGIPAALRKDLFTPFVTGSAARTSGGGTGLGMAIARKITERHGGSIRLLEDKESRHSTATLISLPSIKKP